MSLSYSESYINFFYNNANYVNSNIYPIIKNIFFNDRIELNAILFWME